MKKFFFALALTLVSVSAPAWEVVAPNDPIRPAGTVLKKLVGSSTFVYDGAPQQPVDYNSGCVDIATPQVTLDAITPKNIADYIPGASGFTFRVTAGEVVVSHGGMIATGGASERIGLLVASGSSLTWRDIGSNFVGKFMANSATASLTFDIAW